MDGDLLCRVTRIRLQRFRSRSVMGRSVSGLVVARN